MYSLFGALLAVFPRPVAAVLTAACYATVIALIMLLLPVSPADFRYGSY
jgi:cytochrome bd-type quinol oxidase subunit 2